VSFQKSARACCAGHTKYNNDRREALAKLVVSAWINWSKVRIVGIGFGWVHITRYIYVFIHLFMSLMVVICDSDSLRL
jgi:hypothetical protein